MNQPEPPKPRSRSTSPESDTPLPEGLFNMKKISDVRFNEDTRAVQYLVVWYDGSEEWKVLGHIAYGLKNDRVQEFLSSAENLKKHYEAIEKRNQHRAQQKEKEAQKLAALKRQSNPTPSIDDFIFNTDDLIGLDEEEEREKKTAKKREQGYLKITKVLDVEFKVTKGGHPAVQFLVVLENGSEDWHSSNHFELFKGNPHLKAFLSDGDNQRKHEQAIERRNKCAEERKAGKTNKNRPKKSSKRKPKPVGEQNEDQDGDQEDNDEPVGEYEDDGDQGRDQAHYDDDDGVEYDGQDRAQDQATAQNPDYDSDSDPDEVPLNEKKRPKTSSKPKPKPVGELDGDQDGDQENNDGPVGEYEDDGDQERDQAHYDDDDGVEYDGQDQDQARDQAPAQNPDYDSDSGPDEDPQKFTIIRDCCFDDTAGRILYLAVLKDEAETEVWEPIGSFSGSLEHELLKDFLNSGVEVLMKHEQLLEQVRVYWEKRRKEDSEENKEHDPLHVEFAMIRDCRLDESARKIEYLTALNNDDLSLDWKTIESFPGGMEHRVLKDLMERNDGITEKHRQFMEQIERLEKERSLVVYSAIFYDGMIPGEHELEDEGLGLRGSSDLQQVQPHMEMGFVSMEMEEPETNRMEMEEPETNRMEMEEPETNRQLKNTPSRARYGQSTDKCDRTRGSSQSQTRKKKHEDQSTSSNYGASTSAQTPVIKNRTKKTFIVEKIHDVRLSRDYVYEFRAKWKGYPDEDNSWERYGNFDGELECPEVKKFIEQNPKVFRKYEIKLEKHNKTYVPRPGDELLDLRRKEARRMRERTIKRGKRGWHLRKKKAEINEEELAQVAENGAENPENAMEIDLNEPEDGENPAEIHMDHFDYDPQPEPADLPFVGQEHDGPEPDLDQSDAYNSDDDDDATVPAVDGLIAEPSPDPDHLRPVQSESDDDGDDDDGTVVAILAVNDTPAVSTAGSAAGPPAVSSVEPADSGPYAISAAGWASVPADGLSAAQSAIPPTFPAIPAAHGSPAVQSDFPSSPAEPATNGAPLIVPSIDTDEPYDAAGPIAEPTAGPSTIPVSRPFVISSLVEMIPGVSVIVPDVLFSNSSTEPSTSPAEAATNEPSVAPPVVAPIVPPAVPSIDTDDDEPDNAAYPAEPAANGPIPGVNVVQPDVLSANSTTGPSTSPAKLVTNEPSVAPPVVPSIDTDDDEPDYAADLAEPAADEPIAISPTAPPAAPDAPLNQDESDTDGIDGGEPAIAPVAAVSPNPAGPATNDQELPVCVFDNNTRQWKLASDSVKRATDDAYNQALRNPNPNRPALWDDENPPFIGPNPPAARSLSASRATPPNRPAAVRPRSTPRASGRTPPASPSEPTPTNRNQFATPRGRPRGSKNRPKDVAQSGSTTAQPAEPSHRNSREHRHRKKHDPEYQLRLAVEMSLRLSGSSAEGEGSSAEPLTAEEPPAVEEPSVDLELDMDQVPPTDIESTLEHEPSDVRTDNGPTAGRQPTDPRDSTTVRTSSTAAAENDTTAEEGPTADNDQPAEEPPAPATEDAATTGQTTDSTSSTQSGSTTESTGTTAACSPSASPERGWTAPHRVKATRRMGAFSDPTKPKPKKAGTPGLKKRVPYRWGCPPEMKKEKKKEKEESSESSDSSSEDEDDNGSDKDRDGSNGDQNGPSGGSSSGGQSGGSGGSSTRPGSSGSDSRSTESKSTKRQPEDNDRPQGDALMADICEPQAKKLRLLNLSHGDDRQVKSEVMEKLRQMNKTSFQTLTRQAVGTHNWQIIKTFIEYKAPVCETGYGNINVMMDLIVQEGQEELMVLMFKRGVDLLGIDVPHGKSYLEKIFEEWKNLRFHAFKNIFHNIDSKLNIRQQCLFITFPCNQFVESTQKRSFTLSHDDDEKEDLKYGLVVIGMMWDKEEKEFITTSIPPNCKISVNRKICVPMKNLKFDGLEMYDPLLERVQKDIQLEVEIEFGTPSDGFVAMRMVTFTVKKDFEL